jgi:hypothetical protein
MKVAHTVNLGRVLLAPWIATPHSLRWFVVIGLVLFVVADVLGRFLGAAAHPWLLTAATLGIGNGFLWFALMSNCVLLALDARRLRLPVVGRDILLALFLYALLGIGIPVLLQIPHGHAAALGIVLVLGAGAGAVYMLLPAWLSVAWCFVPMLYSAASHVLRIPALSDPRFVPWGAAAVVILVLIVVARWRQLLRGRISGRGLGAPSVINFRRNLGRRQPDPITDVDSLRRRPQCLLARTDLAGVGAQAPGKSLRVALGGSYLPQTIVGRLYQLVATVLYGALTALLLLVVTAGDHAGVRLVHYLLSPDGFVVCGWMFAMLSLLVVVMPIELLALRWSRLNAELPLLALLPGLNTMHDSKRVLLHVALRRPTGWLGLLLLLGWIGATSFGVGWPLVPAMLVVALGCLGYLYAMALSIFGGRPLRGLGNSLLMIGMFVLFSLTMLLPQLWHDWAARSVARADGALAASWLVLLLFLCWLGSRGWRALQQRPHPFLPD